MTVVGKVGGTAEQRSDIMSSSGINVVRHYAPANL